MSATDLRATAQGNVALVADIGGTNARFALTDLDAPTPTLREAKSLPAAEFASLQHAIEHYLADVGVQPRRGALAVASPADRDEIRLTNRAWSFNRGELQRVLGFDELRVINDFGAVAWAVPALTPADRETLHVLADVAGIDAAAVAVGVGGRTQRVVRVARADGEHRLAEVERAHGAHGAGCSSSRCCLR